MTTIVFPTYYDCKAYDDDGNCQGVGTITISGTGDTLGTYFSAPVGTITLSGGDADYATSTVVSAPVGTITLSGSSSRGVVSVVGIGYVRWSKIRSLDFTVDKTNEAGRAPVPQGGLVYKVKRLGNKIIAYGASTVSELVSSEIFWGLRPHIHPVGIASKLSVAGNDQFHFFVDKNGNLFRLSEEGFQKYDFSEYLSTLTTPVLTWMSDHDLLNITNGTTGYIFSPNTNSLGGGYANLTGYGSRGGTSYAVAPTTIVSPVLSCVTDIWDFGTRKMKTVHTIEVSTNISASGILQVAVEYSRDIGGSFTSSSWVAVDDSGKAKIVCRGREFKFKFRIADTYEYVEIDNVTVNGVYHVH